MDPSPDWIGQESQNRSLTAGPGPGTHQLSIITNHSLDASSRVDFALASRNPSDFRNQRAVEPRRGLVDQLLCESVGSITRIDFVSGSGAWPWASPSGSRRRTPHAAGQMLASSNRMA